MKRITAFFVVLLLASAATPAAAISLESVIEGKFAASGLNRIRPENPAERLLCRLVGERLDTTRFVLSGRCATPGLSGTIRIELAVLRPGAQYEMTISVTAAQLHGYDDTYRYIGAAAGNRVDFATDFLLEGKRYRSNIRFLLGRRGIERIVETVTAEVDGLRTILFDLKVVRE